MLVSLWILATALVVIAALKNANDGRRLAAVLLMPIVLAAGPAVAYGLKVATARLPQKLDPYLYNVDKALFSISPSSAFARDLEGTQTLAVLLTLYAEQRSTELVPDSGPVLQDLQWQTCFGFSSL